MHGLSYAYDGRPLDLTCSLRLMLRLMLHRCRNATLSRRLFVLGSGLSNIRVTLLVLVVNSYWLVASFSMRGAVRLLCYLVM